MSSSYRILCLSHDPAVVAADNWESGNGWQSGNGGLEAVVEAVTHRTGVPALVEHLNCDLLVGRYSYSLVEVGCPPTAGRHRDVQWVDVGWLRLLARYLERHPDELRDYLGFPFQCWTPERLHRLRDELGAGR